jgi:tetratricopeptide (TPR) repeat protein
MKKTIINILTNLWFPLLILLSLLILTIQFASGQNMEINEAKRLIELDQRKKATQVLSDAIQKYPTDAALWYHLGTVQTKNGERDLAINSFEKGIAINEKEPLNYLGRGVLFMQNNELQKAEIDFDRALTLTKGKNVSILNGVAAAYLTDSKWVDKALSLLLKSKSIDDQNAETLLHLGDAYLAQNNGGAAVTSYERAATLETNTARPFYKIGLVYLRSRNFKGAEDAFLKATQVDQSFALAYKELGELYYQMKEGAKAVQAYETYLSLTDHPETEKIRYAFFLFMAKDFTKANDVFASLIEQKKSTPTLLRFYAFSLYEAGLYHESQKVFDQYFSNASVQEIEASDYAYYGKLLIKQNQDSLGIINLTKSLLLESNQPDIVQMKAESLFKCKRYQEAVETYESLLMLRTKPLSQDYYALGRACYFNQQYDKAEGSFQKLIELQPQITTGYLWLARTKSNLDPESENGSAKPYYEAVVEKALATPEKNKKDLVEAYSYLGYYHFIKHEFEISKKYWNNVLEINPNDEKAKEALKALQ